MSTPILLYIGTSKKKAIRGSGVRTLHWGKNSYSKWAKLKSPVAKKTVKVAYDKKSKDKVGTVTYWGAGDGNVHYGTRFPRTASRPIEGVYESVDVRVYVKGATTFTRTSALKHDNKMKKSIFSGRTNSYYYRFQYKDEPSYNTDYSRYEDGTSYINFWYWYYDDTDHKVITSGKMMHPQTCNITYFDVDKNFDTSKANNNSGRDNKGTLVMKKVRCNLVQMELEWNGLSADDGDDLLDTLNPSNSQPYVVIQYYDPATNAPRNATCFASERTIEKYPNGQYKSISVTLTEV